MKFKKLINIPTTAIFEIGCADGSDTNIERFKNKIL